VGNPNALKYQERGDRPGEGLVGEKPPPELDGGRRPETLMVWELGERRLREKCSLFFLLSEDFTKCDGPHTRDMDQHRPTFQRHHTTWMSSAQLLVTKLKACSTFDEV
jgi:hypothetical protein